MLTFAYMGSQEWLILAGLAVLLFGGAKLPQGLKCV
jgi:Sec-independent protein translocase protein TatA